LTDSRKLEAMKKEIAKTSKVPESFVFVDAPPEVQIKVNPVFGTFLKDIVVYDKKEKRTRSIEEFDPKTVDALSTLQGVIRIYTLDKFSGAVQKAYNEYKAEYM